jgi:hypothetical protein
MLRPRSILAAVFTTALSILCLGSCGSHDGHGHGSGDGHHHGDGGGGGKGHSHGPATALGDQTAGDFTVDAAREGDVTPGRDTPFGVTVRSANARPSTVRLWVGTEDGRGSIRARAELEAGSWHAHVEIPSPLPADAMLWIEIEADQGRKTVMSFDLKL